MQFEILAPAGSMESLIAGVRCGAHAVYLGGQTFNARRGAGNFSPQELQAAVQYCHTRGVKVYMTLNTLVSDSELPGAVAAAGNALDAGVDAFIVQDLGLAAALAAVYPGVHLHASTQCSVTTPAGFQALEKMGFRRAVIPREMTAAEIEEIRRSTQMELELLCERRAYNRIAPEIDQCLFAECLVVDKILSELPGRFDRRRAFRVEQFRFEGVKAHDGSYANDKWQHDFESCPYFTPERCFIQEQGHCRFGCVGDCYSSTKEREKEDRPAFYISGQHVFPGKH